ncbi:hypothetical protein EZV62_027899 [Acer yangbiense]|uniref:Protein kinase domain-containing protein n=1 Tax=Acer yangbiense TaxID=1000413 RepID=A0A5C7GQ17_9ROSI|nr:hypothetical protein EZV62_027899 [Acer yangbiense]
MDYLVGICSPAFPNTTVNCELFDYSDGTYENVTFLYDFPPSPLQVLPCNIVKNSLNFDGYSFSRQVLNQGFELKWKKHRGISCENCTNSKGSCGWDPIQSSSSNPNYMYEFCNIEFKCGNITAGYGRNKNLPRDCDRDDLFRKGKLSHGVVGGIAAGSAVAGIIVVVVFVLVTCMCMKNCLSCKLMFFWQEQTLNDQDVEALVKTYGSLAPKRYNYSNIKKMTNSFAVKLGQGGYGVVYRGKLNDGSIVAIKVLSKSKGNGEEFINEVACISRTSHVNIIGLLGFCYEGTRRALIYEFMPNGSLDKFINQGSLNTNLHLEWKTLNQIVIGVARGLEYLYWKIRTLNIHTYHQ